MKKTWVGSIRFTVLLILSLVVLVPYLWMVLSSFKSNLEIIRSDAIFPEQFSIQGYQTVVNDAPFLNWLWNSFVISSIITFATLFTSALAGYIFAKFRFAWKRIIFFLVLSTLMVPFQVIMVPSYIIIYKMGLINNLAVLLSRHLLVLLVFS